MNLATQFFTKEAKKIKMALKEHGFDKNKEIYDLASIASAVKELKSMMGSIYPVGSIYLTMSYNFNPSSVFGGTWSRVSGGYFLMSTTTKNSGITTGGSNTITLSTNNMPAHTHKTSDTTAKDYGGLTTSVWPKVGWDHTFLGSGNKNVGASNSTIFGNVDTSLSGDKAYLVMRPVIDNTNINDGRLHLVGNLKDITAGGEKSVSAPYEVDSTVSRTGSLGGGKSFDNRPQYMEVYMWRRTN